MEDQARKSQSSHPKVGLEMACHLPITRVSKENAQFKAEARSAQPKHIRPAHHPSLHGTKQHPWSQHA